MVILHGIQPWNMLIWWWNMVSKSLSELVGNKGLWLRSSANWGELHGSWGEPPSNPTGNYQHQVLNPRNSDVFQTVQTVVFWYLNGLLQEHKYGKPSILPASIGVSTALVPSFWFIPGKWMWNKQMWRYNMIWLINTKKQWLVGWFKQSIRSIKWYNLFYFRWTLPNQAAAFILGWRKTPPWSLWKTSRILSSSGSLERLLYIIHYSPK